MKLSLAWLKELVDLSGVTAEQAADALTFHTAEVEGVEALGAGSVTSDCSFWSVTRMTRALTPHACCTLKMMRDARSAGAPT